ncbi:MAG: HAD family hydrolase [Anaerovoracaceae bacterium]
MKFDTVVFDLDGTILYTLEDLTDSLNVVLGQENYGLRSMEEVRSFIGEGYRMLLERALPSGTPAAEIDRCTELFQNAYFSNIANKTRPYEGILSLLKELKNLGIRVGVVSNKMDEATKEACRHYFQDYIDVAIGDSPLRNRKPAPDNVYEAIKQLGSQKQKTIFVGDSNVDIRTAKNAGLACVGVTWGYRSRDVLVREGADFIIDEPMELLPLLKR